MEDADRPKPSSKAVALASAIVGVATVVGALVYLTHGVERLRNAVCEGYNFDILCGWDSTLANGANTKKSELTRSPVKRMQAPAISPTKKSPAVLIAPATETAAEYCTVPDGSYSTPSKGVNCGGRPDEKAICDSQTLRNIDQKNAQIYDKLSAKIADDQQQTLMGMELSFITNRTDCKADATCIAELYNNQIEWLENACKNGWLD
jgi:hypothetical protein